MKFGVRQIANVVFKAKNTMKIGNKTFAKGQPVFYMDSAKTSTLEGAATSVYATGGRGNTRLIAWEGEKTLTFTVEDALLSPVSFAMLSGAGVVKGTSTQLVHFHQTTNAVATAGAAGTADAGKVVIDLTDALESTEVICNTAPIFIVGLDDYDDLTGEVSYGWGVDTATATKGKRLIRTITGSQDADDFTGAFLVDYYVEKKADEVSELQIDAERFGGYFYVEADTLFRRQIDGKDLPANLTLPNVKIQSNFTFSMSATGDPSTFTFTMDAFPGFTYFNHTNKVLCAIQIVDDATEVKKDAQPLFPHPANLEIPESTYGVGGDNGHLGDSVIGGDWDQNGEAGDESEEDYAAG